MNKKNIFLVSIAAAFMSAFGPTVFAAPLVVAARQNSSLADFSLEQLSDIIVTSVTRQEERLADAAASIFVISADDIRRSGATTLPEALRLAPNLQIARVDARNYAVTARGFNSPFENKLLVQIDGRTVYSPLFSGVFWDAQDVVLEDVDRIEVISGPGATLWGANAVNGVINVTTRSAKDTQGTLLAAGAGRYRKDGAVRYGGAFENGGHYRVYGKYADNADSRRANGAPLFDGWRRNQTGFRADWGDKDEGFTLQGDAYTGRLHQFGTRDIQIAGGNLLGRANKKLAEDSHIRLQAYYDHTQRDQPNAFTEHLDTFDLDFQHAIKLAAIHNIVWGAGYRIAFDRVQNGPAFAFLPGSQTMHWGNLFVQDEIEMHKNVRLTLGAKLEHNSYTGLESLPSIRLAWKPAADHLVWGAASRAVRAPSRIDRDFYSPSNPAVVGGVPQYVIGGGPNFVSEIAKVYELGYRGQPFSNFSYSATAFYSTYDHLRTLEPNPFGPGLVFSNKAEAIARGIELSATWRPDRAWRLTGGLVAQQLRTKLKPGSADASGASGLANNDPSSYWMLRSSHDIAQGKEIDVTVRRVGALPRPEVPAYTAVDIRFGWKVDRNLELSLVGENLLTPAHAEFGAAPGRSEVEPGVYLRAAWTF